MRCSGSGVFRVRVVRVYIVRFTSYIELSVFIKV